MNKLCLLFILVCLFVSTQANSQTMRGRGSSTVTLSATDNQVLDDINDDLDNLAIMDTVLDNILLDTTGIETAVELLDNSVVVLGTGTYSETTTSALMIGGVRNDTLDALCNTDNEVCPFQFSPAGALYVNQAEGGGFAEDVGHNTAEALVPAGTVRRDVAATSSDTDIDYSTLNTEKSTRPT